MIRNEQGGACSLTACRLCPRECGVDRTSGKTGFCRMGDVVYAARAALHMWEEPCISGSRGSGTVFFSGCTLRCVYCQNHEIAEGRAGLPVTVRRLSEIFLMLQEKGAANISLVTASHFVPQILEALADAKKDGLHLPVVYNSGGYESPDTLRALNGVVDIYLPDLKYMDPDLAEAFSHARDYPEAAREAIREMVAQTGPCVFDEAGYAVRGTIVRHLILPGHTKDSMRILSYLHETYGDEIYISLMNQYTPVIRQERYPELNRRLTKREYQKVLSHALSIGITNGFFQEGTTAEESFIPAFDYEGVRPE